MQNKDSLEFSFLAKFCKGLKKQFLGLEILPVSVGFEPPGWITALMEM